MIAAVDMPTEIQQASPAVQEHYQRMIAAGQSQSFALMAALRQPPGAKLYDHAFRGQYNGNQFEKRPELGKFYTQKYREQTGSEPPKGAVYMPQLAEQNNPGDPRAWVHDTHDMKAVCEDRGWELTLDGEVKVPGEEIIPMDLENYTVNPRHVEDHIANLKAENPDIAPTPREHADLKDKLTKQFSGEQ